MIRDPDAPGRGPGHMGMCYRWERLDDLPVIGYFAGVALGVRKRADTLFVDVGDDIIIAIRYENLVRVALVDDCPECQRRQLLRSKRHKDIWACKGCGHMEHRPVAKGTNPIRGSRDLQRRLARQGRA